MICNSTGTRNGYQYMDDSINMKMIYETLVWKRKRLENEGFQMSGDLKDWTDTFFERMNMTEHEQEKLRKKIEEYYVMSGYKTIWHWSSNNLTWKWGKTTKERKSRSWVLRILKSTMRQVWDSLERRIEEAEKWK